MLFGPDEGRFSNLGDASIVDGAAMALLIGPIVIIGVYPALLINIFQPAVRLIVGGS